jgi:hypothetical protein
MQNADFMESETHFPDRPLTDEEQTAAAGVLGHLNFSTGKPDAAFQANLDLLCRAVGSDDRPARLSRLLMGELERLRGSSPAFQDCAQAETIIPLTLGGCLAAYRAHHADLLFHLPPGDFEHSYLLGCLFEAVLSQGEPWNERGRVVSGAVAQLNDFVGYRPIAVLENGRKMELYDHERFRPVPIYLQGAGVSHGVHHDLIAATLGLLRQGPDDLLHAAHFGLDRMLELALDVRAHDHLHPVNKRTNYMFGEWDPHTISLDGRYTRFILRKIIVDTLIGWVENEQPDIPREERLFDAAAALAGTMLMASSISGSGPDTHDSTISLTTLLPEVARRRDDFYDRLIEGLQGQRRKRLERESRLTRQPFGHIRQHLNMTVAGYGARQVQYRELAYLFARMGYSSASRRQANVIPSASARFECEVQCRLGSARRSLDRGDVQAAWDVVIEAEDLLKRGIECGAIVDPWNILGFHGQFPLFSSREDAIPDPRVEILLLLMDDLFATYSRCVSESTAQGRLELKEEISRRFLGVAEWWDRFGSDVIDDLPDVSGHESWESASQVSTALTEWRSAGEAAGDIGFWKQHVERFQSAQAYAQVVEVLLEKRDAVAAMGLLMQWLSQLDEVGFESPRDSIFAMLIRWMKIVTATPSLSDTQGRAEQRQESLISALRRMFAYLEANADEFWGVPTLEAAVDVARTDTSAVEPPPDWADEPAAGDDEDDLYGAAYEQMTFRDSADDGNWGDTLDDGFDLDDTEFESINRMLEPRLKFLNALSQMWQLAAVTLARHPGTAAQRDSVRTAVSDWRSTLRQWQHDLLELMRSVWAHTIATPSGDQDANLEFDLQFQVKQYIMHQVMTTTIGCRHAERLLESVLADEAVPSPDEEEQAEQEIVQLLGSVLRGEAEEAMVRVTAWISRIKKSQQLLYVPLDQGGVPQTVLQVQQTQTTLRFLLANLPRLGLLRATFHVLNAVYAMERNSRPSGPAITEFDRAFQIALRNSLETLVKSASAWDSVDPTLSFEELLVDLVQQQVGPYQEIWMRHSDSMRLSAVDTEGPHRNVDWDHIETFIRRYGGDLFHASQLTLGNVRAILTAGVGSYLNYLSKERDPLHPIRLIDDIDDGRIDRDDAERCLEFVYSVVVDKFDRFVEYNATTTQSDYGEKFHCLLDFLRLEGRYDRDAWNLIPLNVAHEVIARNGHSEAAFIWEQLCEEHTAEQAAEFVDAYRRLSAQHGMRMPAIADHLNDRFIRPLAVNRMLALVEKSIADAREGAEDSDTFHRLEAEIEAYLEDSWGSGIDVPEWLQQLEGEVERVEQDSGGGRPGATAAIDLPITRLDRLALTEELADLSKPLRRRTPRKSGAPRKPRKKRGQ